MMPSPGTPEGKWSARFPVYQIDFTNVAAGKRIATSKRRIRFRFGFSDAEAIDSGKTGTACRGSEHDVTLVWSISSGKRLILADGHEVHYSTVRSNVFEHSWTMRGNHVLKVLAHAVPPNSPSGQRQYDLSIDGQSFWHMPKVYELGIKGPNPAIARTPGVISAAERMEVSAPNSSRQEKDDLQRAIQVSLDESREHLKRTSINDDRKPAVVAPTPAPATQTSSGLASGDLLDFGFEDTAPAPAPAAVVVTSSAPAPYASPDELFGVPAPAPTPSQVATVPNPFLGGQASAPAPSQVAAISDPFLGGPAPMPAPTAAAGAPNPFLDGPAPTPAPAKVAAPPAPYSAGTTLLDGAPPANSAPATQTAIDPFAAQAASTTPVAQQPAAPQGIVDPFAQQPPAATPTGAPAPSVPKPTATDLASSILSGYGTDEQKATIQQAPEQHVSAADNGTDVNKPSEAQPSADVVPDSITAPPEQKSVEQPTGIDSAMNKLVDFDDIFGQKEETPPLSMNPFGEPEKEKKQPGDSPEFTLSLQSGPQPTLAEMKTVKPPTEGTSSIMEPAAASAATLVAREPQQNANFGGYGHGQPSLSQAQGLAIGGQMQAAAPVDPFTSAAIQPNQTHGYNYAQQQMPVQQQAQPQQAQPQQAQPQQAQPLQAQPLQAQPQQAQPQQAQPQQAQPQQAQPLQAQPQPPQPTSLDPFAGL